MSNIITLDWDFNEIINQIEKMGKDVKEIESPATLKVANVIKSALVKNLPRGKDKTLYQHKTNVKYVHMQDDIHVSGLKTDDNQNNIRKIYGGQYTYYKWRWLEFGTSKMKGTQFMTKTMMETKNEVHDIINAEIKKALDL